jgi:hypothetical protein
MFPYACFVSESAELFVMKCGIRVSLKVVEQIIFVHMGQT